VDKDREERRSNIIIKGAKIPKELEKDWGGCKIWAAELIKEKVGVECNMVNCRKSGTVIILKLESEEVKKKVIKKKYRLKGDKIFIENDLSWEKKKIQKKINRWAKEQKGRGCKGGTRKSKSKGDIEILGGNEKRRGKEE